MNIKIDGFYDKVVKPTEADRLMMAKIDPEEDKPGGPDPDSEVGKTMIGCVRELYGEPVLWPFMPATGPMHPVVADLGIPTVLPVGVGRPDNRIHAPNENIHADDYINAVRLMCRVWERFGAG